MQRQVNHTVPTALFSAAFRESNNPTNQQSTDQSNDQIEQSSVDRSFSQSIDEHAIHSLHITEDLDHSLKQSNNQSNSVDSTLIVRQPIFHEDIEPINQSNDQSAHERSITQAYPDLTPQPSTDPQANQTTDKLLDQPTTAHLVDQPISQTTVDHSRKQSSNKVTPVKTDKLDLRTATLPASIHQSPNQSNNQTISRSPYKQSRAAKRSIFDSTCASDAALYPSDDSNNHPIDQLSFECRRAWTGASRVVFKDLPRLAKRMNVVDDKVRAVVGGRIDNQMNELSNSPSDQSNSPSDHQPNDHSTHQTTDHINAAASDSSNQSNNLNNQSTTALEPESQLSTFDAVQNVVLAVASRLETPEHHEQIARAFQTVGLTVTSQSDFESLVADLFVNVIGEDSLTFAVFRACHQSILFPAVYALKTSVYSSVGDLKDVRRADGWSIEIFIGSGRIQVTHTRVEQSLHPIDSAEHFEVTWNLSLNFDRQMRNLTAAFLRIQELKCHELMEKQRKAFIEDKLKGCGYIV